MDKLSFSSEDDILFSVLNHPCTRNHGLKRSSCKEPCLSRSSKVDVNYAESDVSSVSSDEYSPKAKRVKRNPLLQPGPSADRMRVQNYIT